MAFNSLLTGQSSMAVNSGVNLNLTPDTFAMFQARCHQQRQLGWVSWLAGRQCDLRWLKLVWTRVGPFAVLCRGPA
jgi:hypothetical protein